MAHESTIAELTTEPQKSVATPSARKSYRAPRLKQLGKITELTAGLGGLAIDAFSGSAL